MWLLYQMISPDSKTVLISYVFESKLLQPNCSRGGVLLLERLLTRWMVGQVFHLPVSSEGHRHSGWIPLHRADPLLPVVCLCPAGFYQTQSFQWRLAQPIHSIWEGRCTATGGVQLPLRRHSWKKLVVKDKWHLKKTTTARLWESCSLRMLAGWAPRDTRLGSDPGFKPMRTHSIIPPGTVATNSRPRRQSWSLPGGFPYYDV